MRSLKLLVLCLFTLLLLVACGSPSKEDVVKKLSGKWDDSKGYELTAKMEIKTGAEPRNYQVEVWHTKPDFYRVNVTEEASGESQMIVRNEKGVFVVAPSLGKTYQFQSEWPKENSQGYLIEALAKDIALDENATMTEEDKVYVFETKTRNNHQKILPTQKITIDKKTLLPKKVSVFNENQEEQITFTFDKIALGIERKKEDYAIDLKNSEKADGNEDDVDDDEEKDSDSEDDSTDTGGEASIQTQYPTIEWEGVVLKEEKVMKTADGERIFMAYEGEKKFTLVQERSLPVNGELPVSVEGDPVDLGFTVAALTEHSIRWESGGQSFFLASDNLTTDEMIEVAMSMAPSSLK